MKRCRSATSFYRMGFNLVRAKVAWPAEGGGEFGALERRRAEGRGPEG